MEVPGRPVRVTAAAIGVVVALVLFGKGLPGGGLTALIPSVILVVPELMDSWGWFVNLCRGHIYSADENERFYLYGMVNIRAREEGRTMWFVARHIGDALAIADLGRALGAVPATHKKKFGRDLFISEDGVVKLADSLRSQEAGRFKLFFERQIMFAIQKARGDGKEV